MSIAFPEGPLSLRGPRGRSLIVSAGASYVGMALAALQQWPAWATALAALLPWIPLLSLGSVRMHRRYPVLALFYVLLITQAGHFGEHVAQVYQIHILNVPSAQARGIFTIFDVEWLHFAFNSWIVAAEVVLLRYFRRNGWLRVGLVVAVWHGIEHAVIMWVYLTTGVTGSPGLLSQGGLVAGGLPFIRPDVHFFYNLVETVPILAGFVAQVRRECAVEPVGPRAGAARRPEHELALSPTDAG